jgi:hypothetical protein
MSSIKLTADSGGGTFEIKAPASSSNTRVLTLPDTHNLTLGAGKILQVVSATKTDTQTFSTQGNFDITGLSVSITPSSASNKILVIYTVNVGPTEGGYSAGVSIVRGSTEIFIGDAAGNRRQVSTFTSISNTGGGTDYNLVNANGTHLDSPNTTGATTYKMIARNFHSQNLHINRSRIDSDSDVVSRTASSITVMEVAL